MAERIPDEALVVRGGRNQPEDLRRGTRTHPSGVTGASVESAEGLSVEELATIVRVNAAKLNTPITDSAAYELAHRSRGTPRVANARLSFSQLTQRSTTLRRRYVTLSKPG